jgi:hypothetical protein
MGELEKIEEESPSKDSPKNIENYSGQNTNRSSAENNSVSGTSPVAGTSPVDESTETKNKSTIIPKGKLHWNDQTEDLLVGWADIAACYKWLHESSFRKLSRKNSWYTIPVIVLSTLTGAANLSLGTFVPADFTNVAQAGIAGVNIVVGILMTLQTKFRYAEDSETHFNVSLGWSKLQRNIAIELSVDRQHRKEADYFIRNCRTDYDRLLEQSPTIPEEVIELFKQEMKKEKEMKSKIEKKKRELIEKKKSEKKKKKKKKKNCTNLFGLLQDDDDDDDEDDDKDDGIFIEDENEKLIIPDICGNVRHTKIYKSVLQGNNNIIDTTIKAGREIDEQQNTPILPVIKNTLQDRINELDERISGVNQFKLAQIGQRLAPLNNLMIETHHMSQTKNLPNSEQLTSRNMRNERDTRQQLNIKTRDPLGSIDLLPLNDIRAIKSDQKNINEIKENIDTRYDRDIQLKNKGQNFRRDSKIQGFNYISQPNYFVSSYNERDIEKEIPRKGTVKDLINKFKNQAITKTEEEKISVIDIKETIVDPSGSDFPDQRSFGVGNFVSESDENPNNVKEIVKDIEVDNPLKDENLNEIRENSTVSVYNESPSKIVEQHSIKNDIPPLDLNNVITEIVNAEISEKKEKTMRSNSTKSSRINSNLVSPRKSLSQKFNNELEPTNLGIVGTMKINTPKSSRQEPINNKSDIVIVFKD